MSYYLFTHQYFNTDIEAYMGLIYQQNFPEMDVAEIHHKVFEELKEKNFTHSEIDHTGREEITIGENTYYKNIAENPEIFEEELQLFSVKPFYNFVNLLFFKLGFDAATSTFLISIISYVLILILIFTFLLKILKNSYLALSLAVMFSLFKPLLDSSRHAAPDNLSCLLLLLSFYVFVMKRNIFAATVFAMLCVLTRPDYIIFYTFLFIFLLFQKKELKIKNTELYLSYFYVLSAFLVIQYFNQISWITVFMNQYVKVQLYPISNPDILQFNDYLRVIKSKIFFEFNTSYFPILLIFIVMILAKKMEFIKVKNNYSICLFFIMIYSTVFLRFLIFPMLVNRMMLGFYLLIILSLIYINNSKNTFIEKSS